MHDQNYDPIFRYPPSKSVMMIPGSAIFQLLEIILDPNHVRLSFMRDAVLVSIDLEYRSERSGQKCITQIGVTTLDTMLLSSMDMDDPDALRKAIQCRCFSLSPKKRSAKGWTPKFLWGSTENVKEGDIPTLLKGVLHDTRDTPDTPSRNVILIGHGIRNERRILIGTIGYDIKGVPSVKAILDTARMTCQGYDLGLASHTHFPLRFMLRCLGLRYDSLHNAGNDAMFAMKALLLMFANWKYQKGRHLWNILDEAMSCLPAPASRTSRDSDEENLLWEVQIEVFTAIARASWPVSKK